MKTTGQAGRRPARKRISLAATALLCAAAAPAALAQTGGVVPSFAPRVSGFECRALCTGVDSVRTGGTLRVTGANLAGASRVTFLGGPAAADDVTAVPRAVRDDRLDVTVPAAAASGPVLVRNAQGQSSKPSARSVAIFRGKAVPDRRSASGAVDAQLATRRVFFAGRRGAVLRYLVLGTAKAVRIDLVSGRTNEVVARWNPGVVPSDSTRTVAWNGLAKGRLAPEGRYQFRVYTGQAATATREAATAQADPSAADSFAFLAHEFPIRGRHDYGGAGGRFGAGRAGHTHQGQDVMAACGTPLVAARGGVVQHKAFHSAAGNYLVIDGAQTPIDYAYMHLREPALVDQGQRVYTGQLIGYVGDTGDARGCHLHFEMWSGPGWYEGGQPFDPLAALKAWDRVS